MIADLWSVPLKEPPPLICEIDIEISRRRMHIRGVAHLAERISAGLSEVIGLSADTLIWIAGDVTDTCSG